MLIDMKRFLSLALFLALFSCSSEKPADEVVQASDIPLAATAAGQYGLELKPQDANVRATLYLLPKGFNMPDAKILWLINGSILPGEASNQLKAGNAKKGQTVQAKAIVNGKEVSSNIITIKNSPPSLGTVKLLPEVFKPGDLMSVEVSGADPDGDAVTFVYAWTKNGEPAGKGKTIDSTVKRGDKVACKITPFDGETYGSPGTLSNETRNMPPMIVDNREFTFDGRVFSCQVKANDPDGDPLSYSLKAAPPDMNINPATGVVTWNVPEEFKGKTSFVVSASDGKGGECLQTMNFEVSEPQVK